MPPEQRSDEIAEAPYVEGTGHEGAGKSMCGGGVPSYLGTVDAEVWRDGSVETLFGEDIIGFFGL